SWGRLPKGGTILALIKADRPKKELTMRPQTTLFATAILALSLAPAAQAQGYGHPPQTQDQYQPQDQYQGQDQGQSHDQYQDHRYQNLDRYSYPDAAHIDRVSELA